MNQKSRQPAASRRYSCSCCSATTAHAQGLQTGTITGIVSSQDDAPLPGVTVIASSPALQDERVKPSPTSTACTTCARCRRGPTPCSSRSPASSPPIRHDVAVTLGGTADVHATLPVATQTEIVTVTAEAPSVLATTTTGRNFTKAAIDALPVGRRPTDVAELAPGLTANTFNAGQLAIGGALRLRQPVHGERRRHQRQRLRHAEQPVHRRRRPGSLGADRRRARVVRPLLRRRRQRRHAKRRQHVQRQLPPEPEQPGVDQGDAAPGAEQHRRIPICSAARTRAPSAAPWRSTASGSSPRAATSRSTLANTFAQTAGAYTRTDTNRRGEVKLTGTPGAGQMVQASYITNHTRQANASGLPAAALVDASTLVTRTLPNDLFAASYNGVLAGRLLRDRAVFAEDAGVPQQRRDERRDRRLAVPDARRDGRRARRRSSTMRRISMRPTPRTATTTRSPASVSYLLSTRAHRQPRPEGRRRVVRQPRDRRQLAVVDRLCLRHRLPRAGRPPGPERAAAGPSRCSRPACRRRGTSWPPAARRSISARRRSTCRIDGSSSPTAHARSRRPRRNRPRRRDRRHHHRRHARRSCRGWRWPSTSRGNGRTVVQATYGMYGGRYGQTQFATNTNVGRPSEVDYVYTGPAGQGADFAPGFDVANYSRVVFANFPTANVRIADDLTAPLVSEATAAIGQALGRSRPREGHLRLAADDELRRRLRGSVDRRHDRAERRRRDESSAAQHERSVARLLRR